MSVAHGRRSTYTHRKCRCEECLAANRAYGQRYQKARYASDPAFRAAVHARCRKWRTANPVTIKASHARRIQFPSTAVSLSENPRIGVCGACKRSRQDGERQFDMHHDAYDSDNPLAHARELCVSCHSRLHWAERKTA